MMNRYSKVEVAVFVIGDSRYQKTEMLHFSPLYNY